MGRQMLARTQAIRAFAAALSSLRDSVGTPSFRAMAGRSGAISHTTLHEAAQGNRLPSWETTVEFVKACQGDPLDYRQRWEQASKVVRSARPAQGGQPRRGAIPADALGLHPPPEDAANSPDTQHRIPDPAASQKTPDPQVPLPDGLGGGPPGVSTPPRATRPRWRAGLTAMIVALALVAAGAVAWSLKDPDPEATAMRPQPLTADQCPVHESNPPPAPPEHGGDQAAFIADLTLPDCSHVAERRTLTKTWRFKNAGSVPWIGYTLDRVDLPQEPGQCQTIPKVPIPRTPPGQLVDIEVEVDTPSKPTFCFVRFKIKDADGTEAFPGSRPVNFQIIVD